MLNISFNPSGRQEIHQLETLLLVGSLFRPEVLESLKGPTDRLTWVDSLAVAAGALARSKAGMPVSQIAEELGRSEASIREHLKGSSKAGKLVNETYELLKSGKLDPFAVLTDDRTLTIKKQLQKIRDELNELLEYVG